MTVEYKIRHADRGLLGQTQIRAEFKYECYAHYSVSGPAEVTTTVAFIRAVQTWTTVSIITYFFNAEPVAPAPSAEEWPVNGALVQLHTGSTVELLPDAGEALTIDIKGQSLIIAAINTDVRRELFSEAITKIAVLRLERILEPQKVASGTALFCGLAEPLALVAQ